MPDLHTRGHELEKAFKAMTKKRMPRTPYVGLHRDRYLKPAATEDWERLANTAVKQRQSASKALKQLASLQGELQKLHKRAMTFVADAQQDWVPLQARDDWPDMRERILAKLPEGAPSEAAEELVKKIGALGKRDLASQVLEPLLSRSGRLDEATTSWQAALSGAELAQTVATFNELKHPSLEPTKTIDKWLREAASVLETKQKAIWRSLRRAKIKEAEGASRDLLQWVRGEVLEKATATAAALWIVRQDSANRWPLGRQALTTADLLRDLFAAQALSCRTASLSGSGFGRLEEWSNAADRLPFPSRWRPPSPTPISVLWAKSQQHDGKLVTVEGVVGPVSNAHRARKVFSSVWLFDRQGNSMRVGIMHIKLDSGGLAEGAYASVTGQFATKDKDFGTPLVRVSRRTLVRDSKQSWKDWSALHTRQLFTPVPHALTISFSWEKGLDGPGNQLRYGTWLGNTEGD